MHTVTLADAKSQLTQLIEQIASGAEKEIVISRDGKPVARVVPAKIDTERRIGIARGEFEVPDDIDAHSPEVAALFRGDT